MKKVLVCGAGGFIGGHLVTKLKNEGCWVRGVDIKNHEHKTTDADEFLLLDLRSERNVRTAMTISEVNKNGFDEVYQLAADMGGAGYIFTGEHDADVMHNSAMINLNVAKVASEFGNHSPKIFYSSSACMYPEHNQLDPDNPMCSEDSAYPADPDSEYGWEKLFSERLYFAFARNYNLDVRVARFHNIFGPLGTWEGGREKAPAAMCRKAAEAENGTSIEVWGDGKQTRSFLYIDECIEAMLRLMESDFTGPVNIGSEEMIAINDFAQMAIDISGKDLTINNIPGPEGVRGRNSDNALIREKLGWDYEQSLRVGMEKTYAWIYEQLYPTQPDFEYDDGVVSTREVK
tara:strand:+ start:7100 stop:8137 length:1038 start_codon:yes stop_codon:yes gene_type:complete